MPRGPRLFTRRSLLTQLGLLGAGLAAAPYLRDRFLWPPPEVTFEGGRARTDWLPMRGPGPLVEAPAHIHDAPLRVVVDTGAQFSAIDAGFAERLGLKAASPLPMLAFGVSGGPTLTRMVELDLDLGQLHIAGLRAAMLDLAGLSRVTGRNFAMLLGRDALKAMVADFDFPRRRVAFARAEGFAPPDGVAAAPGAIRNGALMSEVQIEGARRIQAMIDTGATGALALSEAVATAAGLLQGREIGTGRSVGIGGLADHRLVFARDVAFGPLRLKNVPVQIFRPSRASPAPGALLGVMILRHFRTVLDLGAGRLYLGPPERPARSGGRRWIPVQISGALDSDPVG